MLWYFAIRRIALGKLSHIADNMGRGFADWDGANNPDIEFAAIQGVTSGEKQQPTTEFETTLLEPRGRNWDGPFRSSGKAPR